MQDSISLCLLGAIICAMAVSIVILTNEILNQSADLLALIIGVR